MSDSSSNIPSPSAGLSFSGPLKQSLAANLFGVIGASVLFGITTIQTYLYFSHYPNDSRLLRGSISFLWLLDALHFSVAVHFIYFSMVTNFANPAMLAYVPVTSLVIIVCTAFTGVIVRLIFTWRMWRLNNRWSIAIIINALSLLNTASSLYMTIKVVPNLTYAYLRKFTWAMYINFSAEAAADMLIAGSLCITLRSRRTGIRPTDSVLRTLIIYAISTGLLTCVMEIFTLISFAVWSDTSIFDAIYFAIPKVLFNALLASLNARERLRERGNMISVPLNTIQHLGPDGNAVQELSKFECIVETHVSTSIDPEASPAPSEVLKSEYESTFV